LESGAIINGNQELKHIYFAQFEYAAYAALRDDRVESCFCVFEQIHHDVFPPQPGPYGSAALSQCVVLLAEWLRTKSLNFTDVVGDFILL